jgi:hypothetical protein
MARSANGDDAMLRVTAVVTILLLELCSPLHAGVLSATDMQRVRYYEQSVVPAEREIPVLRDMAARVKALTGAFDGSDESPGGDGPADCRSALRDLPAIGGPALERMVSSLQSIDDPGGVAAAEWVAMLTEVSAEIDERVTYDIGLLKAYQRSVSSGSPVSGRRVASWEERPNAEDRWVRFRSILDRSR